MGMKKAIAAGVLALIAVTGIVLYQKVSVVHVNRGIIQYSALVLGDEHYRRSFNKYDTARASCTRAGLPETAPSSIHQSCLSMRALMIDAYPKIKLPYNASAAFNIEYGM